MRMMTIVAVLLLGLSGCSSPMTTADSCKEFNALGASISDPGSMTADARAKVAGKFADLASKSSDALKDDVQIAANFIKAATTGAPDAEVARLSSEFDAAAKRIQSVCNTVH